MRQTYRRNNLIRVSRTTILIGAGILVLGVFVLWVFPVANIISRGVYRIAPSVWGWGYTVGTSADNFFGSFATKKSLHEDNRVLREELSRMQAHVLDRNLLEERVIELEEALGRTRSDNRVLARVLATPGRSPYDTLVIDIGEDHDVKEGDRVMYGSSFVGEIVDVYAKSAKVRLSSSPGDEHSVLIGLSEIPATAVGRGMGNFEARVPQGSIVFPGEDVVTSDGLIIGKVGAVVENESMPFVRVLFSTPFNITGMRLVEVIR